MGLFINGTGSDDTLRGGDENDVIRGEGGNDKLFGEEGDDVLHGGDGNDTLNGGNDNDALYGDGGNDTLSGGNGDDWLIGGTGDDRLFGGIGNDTYFFDKGWGSDTISNSTYGDKESDVDVIRFGEGITLYDIKVTRDANNLYLTHKDTGDVIKVENHFQGLYDQHEYASKSYGIDKILFADGTGWNQEMLFLLTQSISSGDDHIYGFASNEFFNMGDGNDTVFAGGGNDVVHGDAGNDNLYGGTGNDWLYGDSGNDKLFGEEGDDVLHGGDGNDTLNGGNDNDALYGDGGNDTLSGGNGDDWLIGGTGDDRLFGGIGNDTYFFDKGWGSDTISNSTYGDKESDVDVIRFGEGITLYDIKVTRDANNLYLTHKDTGDVIKVENHFQGLYDQHEYASKSYGIDKILFADGTGWNQEMLFLLTQSISSGDDHIYGFASNEFFNMGDGNDTVFAGGGNDVVHGDAGNDNLYGGTGNDWLYGDSGNDKLFGEEGDDVLHGGDGNDTLNGGNDNDALYGDGGNDTLSGGNGDDWLIGGTGDDRLFGGIGNDTYFFDKGWGSDTISNSTYGDKESDVDVIRFGEGITLYDIKVTRDANNLYLTHKDTGDVIKVENHFQGLYDQHEYASKSYGIDKILFADGTGWNQEMLFLLTQSISSGDDHIYGFASNEFFNMGDGNDTVFAGGGNDVVHGDAGNDNLYGGTGNDWLYGDSGNDKLFGEEGDDVLHGGDGNDTLNGGNDNDALYGDGGNDTLSGGNGDDWLIGGTGDDRLFGGIGNDTYFFDKGWGSDTISNSTYGDKESDVDVIRFGEGITLYDIKVTRDANNLYLTHKDTGDVIKVENHFQGLYDQHEYASKSYGIDKILFADGTGWNQEMLFLLTQSISSGDDHIYGFASNEFFNMGDGNDTVFAGGGNDVVHGDAGNDNLYGGTGNDWLYGDSGNDKLFGEEGDDVLHGGDGNDTLNGGNDNDALYGDGGNDTLSGGNGDDWLIGGTGDDRLFGGIGNDTYFFDKGWGSDTISNSTYGDKESDVDVIRFGEGITLYDIKVTRDANNLYLTHKDTGDVIKVENHFQGLYDQHEYASKSYGIDKILFADGTGWNQEMLFLLANAAPTSAAMSFSAANNSAVKTVSTLSIDSLVSSMAAFAVPDAAASTGLLSAQSTALQSLMLSVAHA